MLGGCNGRYTQSHAEAEFDGLTADTLPIPFDIEDETHDISVVAVSRAFRTRDLPWGPLRAARRRMNNGEEISEENLRAIAERGDGLAAHKYVNILVPRGIEENASDIAYFGAIAIASGRIWPLEEMLEAMQYLDPETEPRERINRHINALYPQAWAGNNLALRAVNEHNGENKLFGRLLESTSAKIDEALARSTDEGSLLQEVILRLQKDSMTQSERNRIIATLAILEKSTRFPVRTAAVNLAELVDTKEIIPDPISATESEDGSPSALAEPAGLNSLLEEELGRLLDNMDAE